MDLDNSELFGVKRLFTFGKAPTDLDYISEKREFYIVSENKLVKIRKVDKKSIDPDTAINELKDLKSSNSSHKKWVSTLVYVPSKYPVSNLLI